jgi:hypothetical protein
MSDEIKFDGCVDCVMWFANGEIPSEFDEVGADEYKLAMADRWKGMIVALGGSSEDEPEPEPHFSRSPCVGCGSPLGGDRYAMIAFSI